MQILSLSSAVAYGHVGNRAAVLPLQRLGFEVWPVDTVQFSNHPGHGGFAGTVARAEDVAALVDGLARLGVLDRCDGLLTGYLGDAGTGAAALAAHAGMRADALYLCDPVMGDEGPGVYVRPGIPDFMRERALPAADVVTPNRFELELLAGQPVPDLAAAISAATGLLAHGPRLVVVTSLGNQGTACLAVTAEGRWVVETPRVDLRVQVNGAGDLLAALLLGRLLKGDTAADALSTAVSAVYAVLVRTHAEDGRELALVAAQDLLVAPPRRFLAAPL